MKTKRKLHPVFLPADYCSSDGMLTTVWGPTLWHFLHTMSFNYPVLPTEKEKQSYRKFILNLKYTLPCRYCRENLKKNLKQCPLTMLKMKNRNSFSRYVYDLHQHINKMLGKKIKITFDEVRERYEHFRARCTKKEKKKEKKELGCTEPLNGKKSKCIIKIVPQENKCKTFQMHKMCLRTKRSKII